MSFCLSFTLGLRLAKLLKLPHAGVASVPFLVGELPTLKLQLPYVGQLLQVPSCFAFSYFKAEL